MTAPPPSICPFAVLSPADYQKIACDTVANNKLAKPIDPTSLEDQLHIDVQHATSSGGYMGDYYRITITASDADGLPDGVRSAKFRYFAKTLPMQDQTNLDIVRASGMATRESHLFGELLPKLDTKSYPLNWSPKCYYNRNELLIFEDLATVNYEHLPEREYFDDAHVHQALLCLARMHASGIVYEQRIVTAGTTSTATIHDAFGPYLTESVFLLSSQWYVVGMEATVAMAAQLVAARPTERWAERFTASHLLEHLFTARQLLEPNVAGRFRSVFSHHDLWNTNIMFQYAAADRRRLQPTHAILIDYQLCRYLPPAVDIVQMLHLTTRREQRDACLERYLRIYFEALSAELAAEGLSVEEFVPWSDLVASYAHYKLYGLACACLYNPATRMPDNAFNEVRLADPQRYDVLSNLRRDDFYAEIMAKDRLYGEAIRECVEELLEHVYDEAS